MIKCNIFWFRRDLRLNDNHGLYRALQSDLPVIPLFIFDREILGRLDNPGDPRITFIYDEISRLKQELESLGSSLLVLYGRPSEVFEEILSKYPINAIYTNHDYEPYAVWRDEAVHQILRERNISFFSFKDQVIFEKNDVIKDDGTPYTVFTPYSRKWKVLFRQSALPQYPSEKLQEFFFKTLPIAMPTLDRIGFNRSNYIFPERLVDELLISNYDKTRDFPYLEGTSRLGLHLRFGTISIRFLAGTAARLNEVYLSELVWREFYMMILWHFPYAAKGAFKPAYNRIPWKNDERQFQAWCDGNTGYPIVDAGMRELNHSGYMHNRLRMITASFLTKHLLIDWRWGEAYFEKKLLDFELASNNGGWQWAAGTGCDATPYFRVFNPDLQAQKYDPDNIYIRKWVPEFKDKTYPPRMVDHAQARINAISIYQNAIRK